MQTKKTTRNWVIASAVAAMLAASTAAVRAQDAGSTTTTPGTTTTAPMDTTTTTTTGTDMSTGTMSGSGSMPGGMMDYHILSNPNYDYVDLMQAKAVGLSDSQIATIAKIAKMSDTSFHTVSRAVQRGETFASLASMYNLKIGDVYENEKEKQQIANYISTYESIGTKNGMGGGSMMMDSMGSGMSGNMSSGSMTTGTDTGAGASSGMGNSTTSTTTTTMSSNMATMDIVDTAMAAKNLTTLVKALQAAGLVDTLKGAGPFTVFAPTNQAFSRLPAGTLDSLMADPAKLKMVLSYHVIPASVDAATAMSMTSPTSPPTVEGSTLQVTKGKRGKLMINDATVTKGDIHATNGIIHIIDRVLLPPMDSSGNIIGATGMTGTDTTGTGTTTPAAPMTPAPDATAPAAPMTPAPATPAQ